MWVCEATLELLRKPLSALQRGVHYLRETETASPTLSDLMSFEAEITLGNGGARAAGASPIREGG